LGLTSSPKATTRSSRPIVSIGTLDVSPLYPIPSSPSDGSPRRYEPKVFVSKNEYIHNTTAFTPFSSGPTNCVGKNLAYLEMRIAVAMVVQNLDMKFEEGYNPEKWYTDTLDYFVTQRGALPTVLTPRKEKV
jgi:cytochrome P450